MNSESKKSVNSAVLLGAVGLLAGVPENNKSTYVISIEFKDSKRSLMEANDKIYKTLITTLY